MRGPGRARRPATTAPPTPRPARAPRAAATAGRSRPPGGARRSRRVPHERAVLDDGDAPALAPRVRGDDDVGEARQEVAAGGLDPAGVEQAPPRSRASWASSASRAHGPSAPPSAAAWRSRSYPRSWARQASSNAGGSAIGEEHDPPGSTSMPPVTTGGRSAAVRNDAGNRTAARSGPVRSATARADPASSGPRCVTVARPVPVDSRSTPSATRTPSRTAVPDVRTRAAPVLVMARNDHRRGRRRASCHGAVLATAPRARGGSRVIPRGEAGGPTRE